MKKTLCVLGLLSLMVGSGLTFANNPVKETHADDGPIFITEPEDIVVGCGEKATVTFSLNYVIDKYIVKYVDTSISEWVYLTPVTFEDPQVPETVFEVEIECPNPEGYGFYNYSIETFNGSIQSLDSRQFTILWEEPVIPSFEIEPYSQSVTAGIEVILEWRLNYDTTGLTHYVEYREEGEKDWTVEKSLPGVKDFTMLSTTVVREETFRAMYRIRIDNTEIDDLISSEFELFWAGQELTTAYMYFENGDMTGHMAEILVEIGQDFVVPEPDGIYPPEGYEFSHWECDEQIYHPGDVIQNVQESMTFTAVCKKTESETPTDPTDPTDPVEPAAPVKKGLSGGAIAGIVIGSVLAAGIGGFSIFWFVIKKKSFADLIAVFKKK